MLSELIVIGFRTQYRAPEVLNDLRRHDWDWTSGLDEAVAVTLDECGRARIQANLDLAVGESAGWIDFWRSLLSTALFKPVPPALAATRTRVAASRDPTVLCDVVWWKQELGLSETFLRDVGAVVKPENSAIFMRLDTEPISPVLQQLDNYGGLIIHTALSSGQDEKIKAVISHR